jgi:hypothetical protein
LRRFPLLANYTAALSPFTLQREEYPQHYYCSLRYYHMLDQRITADVSLSKKTPCFATPLHQQHHRRSTRENSQTLNGILFARQAIPSFPLPNLLNPSHFKYSVSGTEDRYGTLKYLTASVFLADCNTTIFQPF